MTKQQFRILRELESKSVILLIGELFQSFQANGLITPLGIMLRRQLLSKIAKKTIRMKSTIVIYLDLYKFKEKIQNGLQLKQTIRSITTLNKSIFKDIIMNKNPPGNKRCIALILFNKRYFSLINILYLSKISITKSGCYG